MITSQGEEKLWIQTSCRPGEGYFCTRHTTWVALGQPNQVIGPVKKILEISSHSIWSHSYNYVYTFTVKLVPIGDVQSNPT